MRGECIPREHDVDIKGSVCRKEQMESLTAVKNNVAFDLHAVRSEWMRFTLEALALCGGAVRVTTLAPPSLMGVSVEPRSLLIVHTSS